MDDRMKTDRELLLGISRASLESLAIALHGEDSLTMRVGARESWMDANDNVKEIYRIAAGKAMMGLEY